MGIIADRAARHIPDTKMVTRSSESQLRQSISGIIIIPDPNQVTQAIQQPTELNQLDQLLHYGRDYYNSTVSLPTPNAARVLDHLGIYASLATQGFNSETMALLNSRGRELWVLKHGSMFGHPALRLSEPLCERRRRRREERGVRVLFE
jgi:hypothetical protein